MADDAGQQQVTAYIKTKLTGSPLAGLTIESAESSVAVPADWTKEAESNLAGASVGDPVVATVRNPARPLVTGLAVEGVA